MSSAFTILVVDDERQHRALLTELLQDEHRVLLAKDGEQALARAREHLPDLILLDVLMPGRSGFDVIRDLKSDDTTRAIPVIFISALDAVADEEAGLELGAVDYISKPFHPPIVRVRVRNHLRTVHQRRLLERLAMIDALTEIPNRRRLAEVCEQEWRRCLRGSLPVSLMVIDIDCFKGYNDRYGHAAGDVALVQVARELHSGLKRPGDFVARFGGEEFVVLLPEVGEEGGRFVAEQMRTQVESLHIPHATSSASSWLTVSIGGATCVPQASELDPGLFRLADSRLYEAKRAGRNRVEWAAEA